VLIISDFRPGQMEHPQDQGKNQFKLQFPVGVDSHEQSASSVDFCLQIQSEDCSNTVADDLNRILTERVLRLV